MSLTLPPAEGIPPLDSMTREASISDELLMLQSIAGREGLRVIEDYVRFVLDDPGLTRRLKQVRHRLSEAERGLDESLLIGSRDTREDVGTHIMTHTERVRETRAPSWPRTSSESPRHCGRWRSTAS